jgi:hypothetical protein
MINYSKATHFLLRKQGIITISQARRDALRANRISVSLKKNQGMNPVVHFVGHSQTNQ